MEIQVKTEGAARITNKQELKSAIKKILSQEDYTRSSGEYGFAFSANGVYVEISAINQEQKQTIREMVKEIEGEIEDAKWETVTL